MDLIKYRIRQFTMKYSKDKAFKRKQELLQIEASLKQAEEALISDRSASNLEALEKLKNKYDSHFYIYNIKTNKQNVAKLCWSIIGLLRGSMQ